MLLSLNWIKDYLTINKSAKEIADKITLSLSEVEKIQQTEGDTVLEIENKALTHRPDCFSQLGLAREVAAYFNLSIKDPLQNLTDTKLKIESRNQIPLTVKIKSEDLCYRYNAICLTEIIVKESPEFIKKRLKSCGVRPINNIVDITNYVMLALGQPLHAFDYNKIEKHTLIVRKANENEELTTIDGITRKLNHEILVIADKDKPIALAGIIGGKDSEIETHTKTVILESANFNARNIRKSSKFLNLRTEAATRFEKNLDPSLTKAGIMYAVSLIQKCAGGKIASNLIDLYPQKEKTVNITTSFKYLNTLLGLKLTQTEITAILKMLDIKISTKNNEILYVEIPSYRRDLHIEADIAEEVARIYGYDNIPTTLPEGIIKPPIKNKSLNLERKLKLLLIGIGLSEVHLPSFISKSLIELTKDDITSYLKLLNPTSPEKEYLRKNLFANLLYCAKLNLRYFKKFSIFEIGRVYTNQGADKLPKENKRLTAILIDKSYYEVKGIAEVIFEQLNIPFPNKVSKIKTHSILNPNSSAIIEGYGEIGELNSETLLYLNGQKKVSIIDLDFDNLVNSSKKVKIYKTIPLYPAIIEDYTFTFNTLVEIGKIMEDIKKISSIISEIYILDRFKNSITFKIHYQNTNKQLTGNDIKPIRVSIVKLLRDKYKAEFKGKL